MMMMLVGLVCVRIIQVKIGLDICVCVCTGHTINTREIICEQDAHNFLYLFLLLLLSPLADEKVDSHHIITIMIINNCFFLSLFGIFCFLFF